MRLRFVLPVVVLAAAALAQAQQRDPRQYQQVLENPDRIAALQVDKVVATLGLTAAAGFSRSDVHTFLDTNFFHVYRASR